MKKTTYSLQDSADSYRQYQRAICKDFRFYKTDFWKMLLNYFFSNLKDN